MDSFAHAAVTAHGRTYIQLRMVCEELGIDYAGQRRKLMDDDLLADLLALVKVKTDGGIQDVTCIDQRAMALWLSGISPSKVSGAASTKLRRFKIEAIALLTGRTLHPEPSDGTPAEQPTACTSDELTTMGVVFSFDVLGNVCLDGPQDQRAELLAKIRAEVVKRSMPRTGACIASRCAERLPDGWRCPVCPLCMLAWQGH